MIALIYGGAASGKSALAEAMLSACAKQASALVYIATMLSHGSEAEQRIARHQKARAWKGFMDRECYTDLASVKVPAGAAVLLECLGNLVANELFAPEGAGAACYEAVGRGIESLARQAARLIVVSNDVFADGDVYTPETESYCRVLADLNADLARRSDVVAELVCGIPLWHKRVEAWQP